MHCESKRRHLYSCAEPDVATDRPSCRRAARELRRTSRAHSPGSAGSKNNKTQQDAWQILQKVRAECTVELRVEKVPGWQAPHDETPVALLAEPGSHGRQRSCRAALVKNPAGPEHQEGETMHKASSVGLEYPNKLNHRAVCNPAMRLARSMNVQSTQVRLGNRHRETHRAGRRWRRRYSGSCRPGTARTRPSRSRPCTSPAGTAARHRDQ